ncbi:MAG: benzoate/H(+) symporter BenE family transporter [Alphaproteobacteria bacterium]|nr:benzoate/H(+) symporter BenE family transporter [Alphaproteobacteria bacterium]
MRWSLVVAAAMAVLVGFGSTIALILAAAAAVGADSAQATSWVAGLAIATAVTSAGLSLWLRLPIVTAWSTPGAALIAATGAGMGMPAAVGAFVLVGTLVTLAALIRPFGNLIARTPASVASAMLAGILFRFVVAVFEGAGAAPALVLPLVVLFVVARLLYPSFAVLAVLVAGVALAAALGRATVPDLAGGMTALVLVAPAFEPSALIGLGVPLFLVTMAGQNLPGFAVLRASGYEPPVRSVLAATGLASAATAVIGAHTTNLAAITAALCMGSDAHPNPRERWRAGVIYGVFWAIVAVFAGAFVALLGALPAVLIATVAGLALVGPLMGALTGALGEERDRAAAVMTLAVTASGVGILGIGAPFWGLLAGVAVILLTRAVERHRAAHGG